MHRGSAEQALTEIRATFGKDCALLKLNSLPADQAGSATTGNGVPLRSSSSLSASVASTTRTNVMAALISNHTHLPALCARRHWLVSVGRRRAKYSGNDRQPERQDGGPAHAIRDRAPARAGHGQQVRTPFTMCRNLLSDRRNTRTHHRTRTRTRHPQEGLCDGDGAWSVVLHGPQVWPGQSREAVAHPVQQTRQPRSRTTLSPSPLPE